MEAVCRKIGVSLSVKDGEYIIKENREKKLVMVVDDNAVTLRMIKEMIQE